MRGSLGDARALDLLFVYGKPSGDDRHAKGRHRGAAVDTNASLNLKGTDTIRDGCWRAVEAWWLKKKKKREVGS